MAFNAETLSKMTKTHKSYSNDFTIDFAIRRIHAVCIANAAKGYNNAQIKFTAEEWRRLDLAALRQWLVERGFSFVIKFRYIIVTW